MQEKLTEILKGADFIDFGVCSFEAVKPRLLDCRAKSRLPNGAKSVIVSIFPYKVKTNPPEAMSRYAAVPDYHNVCGEILRTACENLAEHFPDNSFEWFIDNSPIPEVYAAVLAGLGVLGENGLLITKEYGSFCFIGEIVTDMEIEYTSNFAWCIRCGKCQTHCPSGCIGSDKKGICLSDVTQKKKELTDKESTLIKQNNTIWGCDICQNACPMNKNARTTPIEAFLCGYNPEWKPGDSIEGRAFHWRGEKVIKRNYDIIVKT